MQSKIVAIQAALIASSLALGPGSAQSTQGAAPPLALKPMTVSATLQKKLDQDYGVAELTVLQTDLERSLHYAWKKSPPASCANGAASAETTLVDAVPNHPTQEQSRRQPSLDYLRSVSVGGAEISGVLKTADGTVVATVPMRHYAMDIREARLSGDTWGDARQALDLYAHELVKQCRGVR